MRMKNQKLKPFHKIFVAEYMKDFNATEAYLRADPTCTNRDTAAGSSYRALQNPAVQKYMSDQIKIVTTKAEVNVEMIIRELHSIATANAVDLFDDNQSMKDLKDIPIHLQKAISSMEIAETYEGHGDERRWTGHVRKIKLWEKTKALELLGKHLSMWMDKLQLSGDINLIYGHRAPEDKKDG